MIVPPCIPISKMGHLGGSVSSASDSWRQLRLWSHSLWVWAPRQALLWQHAEPAWNSLSPLSLPSHLLAYVSTLYLPLSKWINKLLKIKREREREVPVLLYPHQHLVWSVFLILAILIGVKWYLTIVLILTKLSELKKLMCLSSVYLFRQVFVHSFAHILCFNLSLPGWI